MSASRTTSFRVRTNRTGRRTYSREYKLEIVAECSAPAVSVAAIALAHGINANLVRRWIVQHRAGMLRDVRSAATLMLPVTVQASRVAQVSLMKHALVSEKPRPAALGVIEIELDVVRIRVRGAVDAQTLCTVLDMLAKR